MYRRQCVIWEKTVNGIELPKQYLDFMREHNGGEGDIGEAWLVLFLLEELEEINYDYEIDKYLPGHIIIGSDGSGELYGVDGHWNSKPERLMN